MLKVSLTHDIDRTIKTYQYLTHFFKALKTKDFKNAIYQVISFSQRYNVYWNFEKIIDIENKYGIKSTFFFLIESIPFELFSIYNWKLSLGRYNINQAEIVSLIQWLDKNGWEIGLHGSYRSYKDLHLLKKEKTILEDILGHSVIGIRQHYLNLDENTWQIQHEAGFNYDSSWGHTRSIGFKENKIKPFRPFSNSFTVFPLSIMDFCYMNTSNKKEELFNIINLCIENDAILVLNWHNDVFNEKESPGSNKSYCEIIETCLANDAEFDTLSNYYKLSEI